MRFEIRRDYCIISVGLTFDLRSPYRRSAHGKILVRYGWCASITESWILFYPVRGGQLHPDTASVNHDHPYDSRHQRMHYTRRVSLSKIMMRCLLWPLFKLKPVETKCMYIFHTHSTCLSLPELLLLLTPWMLVSTLELLTSNGVSTNWVLNTELVLQCNLCWKTEVFLLARSPLGLSIQHSALRKEGS